MEIRNIAIIAHVDHGKTTLVDQLLKQSENYNTHSNLETRAMDSNDIERERGITILAKTTSIIYDKYRINILDTPGHADFGGEVERIMNMVDGVLLLVEASDGVMPQTKFVLRKALENNLKPIVVINKVDRPAAEPKRVLNQVFDLFIDLGASEEQLDFPVVYASGLNGLSSLNEDFVDAKNFLPLLNTIVNHVPKPLTHEGAFQFQPSLFDYNEYVGRIGIGKIHRGSVKMGDYVSRINEDSSFDHFRVQKIYQFVGLEKIEVKEAHAGDIIGISGLATLNIGDTICKEGFEEALPRIIIDEPTVQMLFSPNNSPFVGKDGKFVTASKIEERLMRETQKDVSLKVSRQVGLESWIVMGRGELHLGILIENMRREGYEFQVSRPKVIIKEIDNKKYEPYEEVQIDVPNDYVGGVMELIGDRRGELQKMDQGVKESRLFYIMPSRGIIGLMREFLTATKGYGVINHNYLEYRQLIHSDVGSRTNGVLISMSQGKTTAYALARLEDRGVMFIDPRVDVYEGMIVGENNKTNDLVVNVIQEKQLTNMRAASKDSTVVLKRPRSMSLEDSLSFINDDELVEVTPLNIRIRKQYLKHTDRKNNTNN